MSDKLRHRMYLDIFQPSAQRIGMSLFKITDQLANRFDSWCIRLDREISIENQIEPQPHLLVPILEGMVYHEDNTPIQEMFYNLLKNSMDKTKQEFCHPSFPRILSQLSVDDIIYLYNTNTIQYLGMGTETKEKFGRYLYNIDNHNIDREFTLSHLTSLGLISIKEEQEFITEFGKQFFKACFSKKAEKLIEDIIKSLL